MSSPALELLMEQGKLTRDEFDYIRSCHERSSDSTKLTMEDQAVKLQKVTQANMVDALSKVTHEKWFEVPAVLPESLLSLIPSTSVKDLEILPLKYVDESRILFLGYIDRPPRSLIDKLTIDKKIKVHTGKIMQFPYLQTLVRFNLQNTSDEIRLSAHEKRNILSAEAIRRRASDISIESRMDGIHVRFQIDKIWHDFTGVKFHDNEEFESFITKMFVDAGEPYGLRQESTFDLALQAMDSSTRYFLRVNIISRAKFGNLVNARIIDSELVLLRLNELNLRKETTAILLKYQKLTKGIIIVAGQTNSGKNTTTTSLLTSKKFDKNKIVTVEDPVEYIIPNAVQLQASTPEDYRRISEAVVRQSPDIIYYSEMRSDHTVAETVANGTTGKTVFTTTHLSEVADIFKRLDDLAGPSLASKALSGLNLVVVQELFPRLCKHCRINVKEVDPKLYEKFRNIMRADGDYYVANSNNTCPHCTGGFKGVIPASEFFEFTREVKIDLKVLTDMYERERYIKEHLSFSLRDDSLRLAQLGEICVTFFINSSVFDM